MHLNTPAVVDCIYNRIEECMRITAIFHCVLSQLTFTPDIPCSPWNLCLLSMDAGRYYVGVRD